VTITNRHIGERIIVAGTSPSIYPNNIDIDFLKTGVVIGINKFAKVFKPDYWLTCDPQNIESKMEGVIDHLDGVETFIHYHPFWHAPSPSHTFKRPEGTKLDRFVQPIGKDYPIPTEWTGHLQHIWTSATAGANLADIMGASEIILYGVDIKGKTMRGMELVDWDIMADDISLFFKRLRCPVYKSNPNSPLDLPLLTTR